MWATLTRNKQSHKKYSKKEIGWEGGKNKTNCQWVHSCTEPDGQRVNNNQWLQSILFASSRVRLLAQNWCSPYGRKPGFRNRIGRPFSYKQTNKQTNKQTITKHKSVGRIKDVFGSCLGDK